MNLFENIINYGLRQIHPATLDIKISCRLSLYANYGLIQRVDGFDMQKLLLIP